MNATDLYQPDRRNELISYVLTIVIHLLILLLLYWAVLMPPNPPWEEMGGGGSSLAMSLGTENAGGPDLIPVQESEPVPPQPETPTNQQQTLTQESEEAPEVVVPKEKKAEPKSTPIKHPEVKKPIEKKQEVKETPRQVDAHSLFQKKAKTESSNGSGSGEAPGNEGRPEGDVNGKTGGGNGSGQGTGGSGDGTGTGYGTGSGSGTGAGDGPGNGFGYDLHGRSVSKKPEIYDNSRETGKVVVQIVVDRSGRVIRATPGFKGTTTLNSTLLEKAKQGALETRFTPKPDGPEEQFGTMTIIFRYRQ